MDKNLIIKGVIALAILLALFMLLKALGVFKSDEEKQADKLLSEGVGGADTGGIQVPKGTTVKDIKNMTLEQKKDLMRKNFPTFDKWYEFVNIIWDAKGTFKDDEDAVVGVFRQFYTKNEANAFAKYFFNVKKRDLTAFMASFMDAGQLAMIQSILKDLPISVKTKKR